MGPFLTKIQRYENLKAQLDTDFNSFLPQYRDLNDYILPSRGRFFLSDSNRGDRRNHKIYDPTAYLSARTLSSGMMAGVTSPARNWKRITTSDPELAEFGPVREWLEVVDKRMTNYFLRSNLYNTLPALYGDLGVFGTPAMMMEEDFEEVSRFYSFPIGTFRLAKDYRGRINVFLREFQLTVRQLVEHFGREPGKMGKPDWSNISLNTRNLWDKGQYESKVDIVQVIEPNENYLPGKMEAKFKKYSSCYYERGNQLSSGAHDPSLNRGVFLKESGYSYFPVLAPRWMVTGMDVYATDCPGMAAIGDIKQIQFGEKRIAQAIDKMVNPPMVASSSLKTSKASIISGDITWLDDQNRDFFKPAHEIRIDLSHIEQKQEQVRQRIKRAFFEDLFLMLASSDRRDYTATEITERKEEKLLAIGPVLEQLNQDVLDPLIDNQFFLMSQQGLIPPAPPEIQGSELKVEYISVMAQAQKMVGIGAMDRLLQMGSAVIQMNPGSANKFDFDQYIDQYADALGTSPRIVRSDEKVEEIRQAQAQAQQAQQQLESINNLANTAKTLSETSTGGDNALSALSEQMTGQ